MRLRTPGERVPAGLKDAHARRHALCENDPRPGRQLPPSYRKRELGAPERIHQERLHAPVAKCGRSQIGNCIANRERDNVERHTFSLRLPAQFRMLQHSGYMREASGSSSFARPRQDLVDYVQPSPGDSRAPLGRPPRKTTEERAWPELTSSRRRRGQSEALGERVEHAFSRLAVGRSGSAFRRPSTETLAS